VPDGNHRAGRLRVSGKPLTRSRLRGGVGLVAVAALCPLAACTHGAAPGSHRIIGSYAVHGKYPDSGGAPPATGQPCDPGDVGYDDINAGTAVVLRDGSGAVLARTTLGPGAMRVNAKDFREDCVFTFSATVPDRASYDIEVGNRGSVSFSRTDLSRAGWHPTLTIGNYTLGT
jgi:hypothetical protein